MSYKKGVITLNIDGGVDSLEKYLSSDPGQQDAPHAWLALDIDTETNDIKTVKYNDYQLTQADVDEATSWGFAPGHFVLHVAADKVAVDPKKFTLSGDTIETTEITIEIA